MALALLNRDFSLRSSVLFSCRFLLLWPHYKYRDEYFVFQSFTYYTKSKYLLPRAAITPRHLRLVLPISSFRDSSDWRVLSYFPWHFHPLSYDIWREYHSDPAKSNAKRGTIAVGVKIKYRLDLSTWSRDQFMSDSASLAVILKNRSKSLVGGAN